MMRGASQDLHRALRALGSKGLRELERAIIASSREHELTYTKDDGKTGLIRLLTTPVLLARADVRYLHGLLNVLLGAFRKTVVHRSTPALAEILPLMPGEEEWFRLAPPGIAPMIARWDLNIDPARGARAATLFELNGCAVGGLHYASTSSEILHQHVAPLGRLRASLPLSLREVWLDLCASHARAHRRSGRRMAWLEDRTWDAGITEGPSLAKLLSAQGCETVVADPRELEIRKGEITCAGVPLDVVYRNIELRDLLEIEATDGPLTALRSAVQRGLVLSPLEGDLDHKSLLEVWSSTRFAGLFSARERAAFRRHVPWTRLLSPRHTDGPDGKRVDLAAYAERHRTRLVIKPNRSCGGDGVLIGKEAKPAAWSRALGKALSGKAPSVVQLRVQGAKIRTPVTRAGRVIIEEHCTTYGMVASSRGVGILGRASPFSVVNVSRGGGLLGVLLV